MSNSSKPMSLEDFYSLINPVERPIKSFNSGFRYIESWLKLEGESAPLGVNLKPEFQREHVWTEQQQQRYVQNILRRICDESTLTIRFNCPSWRSQPAADSDLLDQVVCIDGLQRFTAIRKFIAGELKVFDLDYDVLPVRELLRDLTITIKMYDFQYKEDLYQFYLDINEGGTPHSEEELNKVRKQLAGAKRRIGSCV